MTYAELQDLYPDIDFPPEGTPAAAKIRAIAQTKPRAAADYATGLSRRTEVNTTAAK